MSDYNSTYNTRSRYKSLYERQKYCHIDTQFTIFRSISKCHSISKIHLINFETNCVHVQLVACTVYTATLNKEIMEYFNGCCAANVAVTAETDAIENWSEKNSCRNAKDQDNCCIIWNMAEYYILFSLALPLNRNLSLNSVHSFCWNSPDIVNQFWEILRW